MCSKQDQTANQKMAENESPDPTHRRRLRINSEIRPRFQERLAHRLHTEKSVIEITKRTAVTDDPFASAFKELWSYNPPGIPKKKPLGPIKGQANVSSDRNRFSSLYVPSPAFKFGGASSVPASQVSLTIQSPMTPPEDGRSLRGTPPLPAIDQASKHANSFVAFESLSAPATPPNMQPSHNAPMFFKLELSPASEQQIAQKQAVRQDQSIHAAMHISPMSDFSPSKLFSSPGSPVRNSLHLTNTLSEKLTDPLLKERLSTLREKSFQFAEEARDAIIEKEIQASRPDEKLRFHTEGDQYEDISNQLVNIRDGTVNEPENTTSEARETGDPYDPLSNDSDSSHPDYRYDGAASVGPHRLYMRDRSSISNGPKRQSRKDTALQKNPPNLNQHAPASSGPSQPTALSPDQELEEIARNALNIMRHSSLHSQDIPRSQSIISNANEYETKSATPMSLVKTGTGQSGSKMVRRKSVSTNILRSGNRGSSGSVTDNSEGKFGSVGSHLDRLQSVGENEQLSPTRESIDSDTPMTLSQILASRRTVLSPTEAPILETLTEQDEVEAVESTEKRLPSFHSSDRKIANVVAVQESDSTDKEAWEDREARLSKIAYKLNLSGDRIWLNDYMRENKNETNSFGYRQEPWYQYKKEHPINDVMVAYRANWIRRIKSDPEFEYEADSSSSEYDIEEKKNTDKEHESSFFENFETREFYDEQKKQASLYEEYYFMRSGERGESFSQSTTTKVLTTNPKGLPRPYLTKKLLAKENYSRRLYHRMILQRQGVRLNSDSPSEDESDEVYADDLKPMTNAKGDSESSDEGVKVDA